MKNIRSRTSKYWFKIIIAKLYEVRSKIKCHQCFISKYHKRRRKLGTEVLKSQKKFKLEEDKRKRSTSQCCKKLAQERFLLPNSNIFSTIN